MEESDTVYSVYIHHKPDKDIENLICWERRESTKNRNKAINSARNLYQSDAYNKIEVKKTYHSPKQGKMVNKTIKIYGQDPIPVTKMAIAMIGTILCLTASLWLWN